MERSRQARIEKPHYKGWLLFVPILLGLIWMRQDYSNRELAPSQAVTQSEPMFGRLNAVRPNRVKPIDFQASIPFIEHRELIPPHPSEVTRLIRQLSSPSAEARADAAAQLGRLSFQASEAVPALREIARNDPDDSVQSAARDALLNIRGYTSPLREL